jgi:hypothetical protein
MTTNGYSQDNCSMLAVSIARSSPSASFGNTNLNNPQSGFASPGYLGELKYSHSINKKNFGYAVAMRGASYALNNTAMENDYNNQPDYDDWRTLSSSHWLLTGLYGGGYFSKAIGRNLEVNAGGLAGVAVFFSPVIQMRGITGSEVSNTKQERSSASGLSYALNLSIRYKFTKRLSLFTIADYFCANGKLKTTTHFTTGGYGYSEHYVYKQPVKAISFGLGLALSLQRSN